MGFDLGPNIAFSLNICCITIRFPFAKAGFHQNTTVALLPLEHLALESDWGKG